MDRGPPRPLGGTCGNRTDTADRVPPGLGRPQPGTGTDRDGDTDDDNDDDTDTDSDTDSDGGGGLLQGDLDAEGVVVA